MYATAPQLPADPVNINYQCFIQNLQALPFQPQVRIHPTLVQGAGLVMMHLIGALQANAGKNPIRTFTVNFLSRNMYNNQEFIRVLQDAVSYFELLVLDNGGQHVDANAAASKAATAYATIAAAVFMRDLPGLIAYQNPEMAHEFNQWLQTHNQIVQASQMLQQRMNQSAGAGASYLSQPAGVNAPSMGATHMGGGALSPYQMALQARNGGATTHSAHGAVNTQPATRVNENLFGGTTVSPDQGPIVAGVATTGMRPRPKVIQAEELTFDNEQPRVEPRTFTTAPHPHEQRHHAVTINPPQAVALDPLAGTASVDEPNLVWNVELRLSRPGDGDLIPTSAIRFVYDPANYQIYYCTNPSGKVNLVLSDKESDVKYQDHELSTAVRDQVAPSDALPVGVTAEGLANLERTERELAELAERARDEVHAEPSDTDEQADLSPTELNTNVSTSDGVMMAHSLAEAEMLAQLKRFTPATQGEPLPALRQVIFRELKPMVLSDHELELFEHFEDTRGYEALSVKLPDLLMDDPDGLWKIIDDRLTQRFNAMLQVEFSTEWGMSSFAEDFLVLLEAMVPHYSEQFMNVIQNTDSYVIPAVFQALTTDETNDYLQMLSQMGVEVEQTTADKLVVLSQLTSLTYLPISRDDIAGFLSSGVLPSTAGVFHRVLSMLMQRVNNIGIYEDARPLDRFCRHLIKLTSGEYFEVYLSQMVDHVFVLREIKP